MRLIINYDEIKMTPYEFDKKLVDKKEVDLFVRDDAGRAVRLDHDAYAAAAMNLLNDIFGDKQ